MLDAAEREGRVDLVEALAFPLPFAVIAEMLGTPPADHERASTSRSAPGRITAWARRWPGWRPRSPSPG